MLKCQQAAKQVGCSNLKALIEEDKLVIPDYDTIMELTTFIQKGQSFAAEDGCNDDLAMCLVIFAWINMQQYFKEMHDNDVRQRIYDDQREAIEQDMSPFGFVDDDLRMNILQMHREICGKSRNMEISLICGSFSKVSKI